ncbi:conserved hypothetical protein [Leadbettera azotonutricia ZAS-9]|uniref:Lipoprotein n=1 Tax=Leadbettera azotonutricia (strain ATCC BAA-888 / DSM 13862 / ZAS-9) TaxID=545695 RepID=F5YD34_LEAAZ|nr:conserved hypothetical protein [Leadbettera azotonutricia ZAS-9]
MISCSSNKRLFLGLILLSILSGGLSPALFAQGYTLPLSAGAEQARDARPLFPWAFQMDYIDTQNAREAARPYWVYTEAEYASLVARSQETGSMLLNNDILAFYGHPLSKNMGILGRFTKEELNEKLTALAEEYRAAGGGRGVRKAFYIIFGTVWPEGEIGIIRESILKEYIEFALENDILIFIDHQIGRYTPVDSLKRMLPWLRYPNVHLALDPEWRTTKPMVEIGTVTADEVNQAQKVMEEYIIENHIPGERLLVIHQFNYRMISSRENVDSGFGRVRLVHCADGFGNPNIKRQAYAFNAQASNMPVKGFKLFYNFGIPGAGFDSPLLTPKEVFALDPRPYIVMYQ